MKKLLLLSCALINLYCSNSLMAEDGSRFWLRYDRISSPALLEAYRNEIRAFLIEGESPTLALAGEELQKGLNGLLGKSIPQVGSISGKGILVAGTPSTSPVIASLRIDSIIDHTGREGFTIFTGRVKNNRIIVIAAKEETGVLYGIFHFLRLLQTHCDISHLHIESTPGTSVRLLNHWDNLDRTVERGYAGFSIWDWHRLPGYISPLYHEYARANASIGINGTVLTNVNANALVLTGEYLAKVAALADVFRPYGIRVYLTARFSAPVETGGLQTADPLDPQVIDWWNAKVREIYHHIPDFGGFLVKANSEGQPGPQDYGRSHADGANLLADALAPYQGIVMWRAFVYDNNIPVDRARQAYNEFVPLDGKFRSNVLIQVKNGPIDFQPREPFHPLFGSMPRTPLMIEFQITQEYLGFATHLVYLATLFKECLDSDTYAGGPGSTVATIVDGSLEGKALTGMAGVSNIGNDRNWTGHPVAQSNWFAFGRLAWDPYLDAGEIAEEWIRMSYGNYAGLVETMKKMLLASREIAVEYMTPLGLHHIMAAGHHYGPGPWVSQGRADWTSVYYHRADTAGIGFDRTPTGSNALDQYFPPVREKYLDRHSCPDEFLLWFHHLPWDFVMKSGRTLWEALCYKYYRGTESVTWLKEEWEKTRKWIDAERYEQVHALLEIQEKEARWWRDACVLYFQSFSKRSIPADLEKPGFDLRYYRNLKFFYVPGI